MNAFSRARSGLLVAAAAASALWCLPAGSQGRAAGDGHVPLLRGVARLSCGTARPWNRSLATPGMRGGGGPGSLAAQSRVMSHPAELVGTLELSFGAAPRRGTADAERPPAGSWTATQLGWCTGGRGPLQLAVITPAAEGRPARFELRGPASHIQRPGERPTAEGGEVRFVGTCGRRQQVVMEIWPPMGAGVAGGRGEPDRYHLVGTVTCGGPEEAASGPTATATP